MPLPAVIHLDVTWSNLTAAATGVAMFDLSLERDRDGLETL